MSTARAPSASALTTSEPRRTPPSSSTSTWSPTASAMGLSTRIVAGVPSRLLPPWLLTEIASTPTSTARSASSTRQMPLSMKAFRRSLARSGPSTRRPATWLAQSSSTRSTPRRRSAPPRGCRRPGRREVGHGEVGDRTRPGKRGEPAGLGRDGRRHPDHGAQIDLVGDLRATPVTPHREGPVERRDEALAPAACARCIRCTTTSRSPVQYIWKRVAGLAATTSSTDLEAKLDRPMAVPRAAAARATATSPSGWTAWTPVGLMITGS